MAGRRAFSLRRALILFVRYAKLAVGRQNGIRRGRKAVYQRIRYFLKAAETGNLSQAAQAMYISPQGLTKQIGVLEAELGGRLFVRSRAGAELTAFGKYAKARLEGVVNDFEKAVQDVRSHAGDARDSITLGIFSALPRDELVLPFVSFLLASYPERQIQLEMLELSAGLRKFLDGKLDFLLTNTHEQDDLAGYERITLGTYDAKVVVSLVHPWTIRDSIGAEDMKQETFVKLKVEPDHYTVPVQESFYQNIPCKRVLEANNFETMMVLLGQGAGFAVIPLAFTNVDRSQIKAFDYPGTPLRFSTSLLYDPNNPLRDLDRIVGEIRENLAYL